VRALAAAAIGRTRTRERRLTLEGLERHALELGLAA
jgi:hypothetical protein